MENKTKEKIRETALFLFSQKGFSAVSIRDICKVVGIKESTIYYHFESKQSIFQELLCEFKEITGAIQNEFNNEIRKITCVDKEPFVMVGLSFFNDYLLNERILKFIRMLMIEQHVNKDADTLYHQILFEAPLSQNVSVFDVLIRMGCFKKDDIDCLAEEYYAPIFLVFQRFFSSGEITEENRKKANERLTAHLSRFYDKNIYQEG